MALIDWLKQRFTKSGYASDKAVNDFTRVAKEKELPLDYGDNERLAELLSSDDPEALEEIARLLDQSPGKP